MSLVALLYSSFFINEVLSFIADKKREKERMVLWKNEKSTHVALLDEIEIKLLAFVSKPWIHEGFFNPQRDNFMESSKERNRQSLNFINLKIELLLENTMCSNSKKKT